MTAITPKEKAWLAQFSAGAYAMPRPATFNLVRKMRALGLIKITNQGEIFTTDAGEAIIR